ncbi:MAG: MobQ family relaxase [Lactococcus sp.]
MALPMLCGGAQPHAPEKGGEEMAIFHAQVKVISRSSGRSSVAAAAYRAGEKITNSWDGQTHDFTRRSDVVAKRVFLPIGAAEEFKDRSVLWNTVERCEKRKDSRTAREIEVALPGELNLSQQKQLMAKYVTESFVSRGMFADVAIHDKQDGNPHAHVMLTTRKLDENGQFGKKERSWDDKQNVLEWRENWAKTVNEALKAQGLEERIDHRSYKDQGIDKEPTIHLGAAHQMEKRGIKTEKGDLNRAINTLNQDKQTLQDGIVEVDALETQIKAKFSREKPKGSKTQENEKIDSEAILDRISTIENSFQNSKDFGAAAEALEALFQDFLSDQGATIENFGQASNDQAKKEKAIEQSSTSMIDWKEKPKEGMEQSAGSGTLQGLAALLEILQKERQQAIEQLHRKIKQAESDGDISTAAKLKYGQLPEIKRQWDTRLKHTARKEALKRGVSKTMVQDAFRCNETAEGVCQALIEAEGKIPKNSERGCDLNKENESQGTGTPEKQRVSRGRSSLNPWKNREVFVCGSQADGLWVTQQDNKWFVHDQDAYRVMEFDREADAIEEYRSIENEMEY